MSSEYIFQRLGLLAELTERAHLGRTALMKLLFFLQESKGVSLGYEFSLYSYGPFDSDVLADISTAERLNVLKSSTVYYPSGMGYEYSTGAEVKNVKDLAGEFLQDHKKDIDWALDSFSKKTAAELELLSTIVFVAKFHNPQTLAKLLEQVEMIKPHFSQERIRKGVDELMTLNILRTEAIQ
jgi:hypothetical protein